MSTAKQASRFEKQGFWWLPNSPEREIPGTLVYGHDEDAELQLIGSMQPGFDGLLSENAEGFQSEIILGTTSDGSDFTLLKCHRTNFRMSAFAIETIFASIVIEGRHFRSVEEIVFEHMSVQMSQLDEWLSLTGRSFKYHDHEGSDRMSLTVEYRKPDSIDAHYGSGKLLLGLDSNINFARYGGTWELSEEACMAIYPEQPLHLWSFLENVIPTFTSLVTLGLGTATSITEMRARAAADCAGKTEEEKRKVRSVQLYWKKQRYSQDQKELIPQHLVFTCPEILEDLPLCVAQWVKTYDEIRPVMQLFFGRVMTRTESSANSFLNAVQAAEAYHRYRRDGLETPKAEHTVRKSAIINAVPPAYKDWLKEKLCFSNEKSLYTRLSELLTEHLNLFQFDSDGIARVARRVTDLRNLYTHYSGKNKAKFGTGEDFFILGTLLQWLLVACLLEELGLSRTRAHALLNACEPFRFFRNYHVHKQPVRYFTVTRVPASEVPESE